LLERDQGGDDSELAFEQTSCWTWPVRGSERSGCGAMGKASARRCRARRWWA